MPPRRSSSKTTFVERHDLWTPAQHRAASAAERAIKKHKLDLVRFSFVDQHGTLRGKTLMAADAAQAMRSGVTMTTTLLAKDTSHRTVFPVFTAGGGMNVPEMQGAGDFVMVADPATFRVLPWAPNTGWMLCDIVFTNGRPVPLSTRQLYRDALAKLGKAGFDYCAGLEVEFHLFKIENPKLEPDVVANWPPEPPEVSLTTTGFQYLTENRFDQVGPIMDVLRETMLALGMPLRSQEVELGPSQYEFTFAPELGLAAADTMVLFRSAMKQVARRHGYLISFMCRPKFPNVFSSGWHLHQSLIGGKTKANAFVSNDKTEILSPLGRHFLAGLIAHARAGAAFGTPTLNGYKRYHGVNTMAPIQAVWARDNRGVMVRVMGQPGDAATHLENRVGEPLANPYLYMASQIHAGLDGVTRKLAPGPSADAPYEMAKEPLPKTLAEACDALAENACMRSGFGAAFVDYYVAIKRFEIARAEKDRTGGVSGRAPAGATPGMGGPIEASVSSWEHREYLDMA
jgi:glutamine synthetase